MKKILLIGPILAILGIIFLTKSSQITEKATNIQQGIEIIQETIAPKPTVIQSNGLPDSHQINTTFVPQSPEKDWSQPWQDACEEASALTAIYYYNHVNPNLSQIKTDILSLIETETNLGWGNSINVNQLSQLIKEKYNLDSKIITDPSIDQIKELIATDTPIIVPANGKSLYQENKHFKNGGPWYHFVTILGYNDRAQKFTVHDVGTQFGAYYRYSYSLLMSSIHDLPDSNDVEEINKGSPKIIYLLK